MQRATGPQADALIEAFNSPDAAPDLFQAVRFLQSATPDAPAVGTAAQPRHEAIRFVQPPSLAFPTRTIGFVRAGQRNTIEVGVNAPGLLGPSGPLPFHVTTEARRRTGTEPGAFRAFLDIFNHRMAALMYRAWAVQRLAPSADRPEFDHHPRYLASVAGLEPEWGVRHDLLHAAIRFTGRFTIRTRNPEGLAAVLRSYFETPARIIEFVPDRIEIGPVDQCCLGANRRSALLGQTTMLGSKVPDVQGRFRVRLGPMRLALFQRLLPGEPMLRRLHQLIAVYCGPELHYDVQLVLDRRDRPSANLGKAGRLGCTAWIGVQAPTQDPDDLIINRPEHTLD